MIGIKVYLWYLQPLVPISELPNQIWCKNFLKDPTHRHTDGQTHTLGEDIFLGGGRKVDDLSRNRIFAIPCVFSHSEHTLRPVRCTDRPQWCGERGVCRGFIIVDLTRDPVMLVHQIPDPRLTIAPCLSLVLVVDNSHTDTHTHTYAKTTHTCAHKHTHPQTSTHAHRPTHTRAHTHLINRGGRGVCVCVCVLALQLAWYRKVQSVLKVKSHI